MITINLLPIESLRSQVKGKAFLAALFLFVILFIGFGLIYMANVVNPTIAMVTTERDNLKKETTTIQAKLLEAEKKGTAIVKMWQRLVAILELEENRRDQTRLLVELDELLPKGSAWLMGFSHAGGIVTIKGIATDQVTVSQFYSKLEQSKYLRNVALVDVSMDMKIKGIKLTQFNITAESYFPFPDLVKNGLPEAGLPSEEEFRKVLGKASPALIKILEQSSSKKSGGRRAL